MSIGLSDVGPTRTADPRHVHYIIDAVTRGNTLEREVVVTNATVNDLSIEVYVGDAAVRGRRFAFDDELRPGGVASWSRVAPSSLVLAAGASATAVVAITPPLDAAPGEHYGVIWAQLPARGDASVVNRVGVRMYLALGNGTVPPSDLSIDAITPSRDELGGAQLAVNVTNIGGRALDVAGTVELRSREGSRLSAELDPGTVIPPGDSGEATARFADVDDGPWEATAVVRANGVERQAAGTITFPTDRDRRARPVVVTAHHHSTKPLVVVALGGALVAIVAFARLRAGRRRDFSS